MELLHGRCKQLSLKESLRKPEWRVRCDDYRGLEIKLLKPLLPAERTFGSMWLMEPGITKEDSPRGADMLDGRPRPLYLTNSPARDFGKEKEKVEGIFKV